jgi:exodeoxyribonuclease V beta subunit
MNKTQEFDVLTVNLDGSRLIEASAGTGKTYSIAILVLRMILERNISVDKILMVTFTKSATAELETRIRKFVREAYDYAAKGKDVEATIKKLIGEDRLPEKSALLRKAVQDLDKLSIMTINGFCQSCIDAYTFETNQAFDYEVISEDTNLLMQSSQRYFREVLNTLDKETYKQALSKLKLKEMPNLLRKHLTGMHFRDVDIPENTNIDDLKRNINDKEADLKEFVAPKFPEVMLLDTSRDNLKKAAANNDADGFIRTFRSQLSNNKPAAYFDAYGFMKDKFIEHNKAILQAEKDFINYFYFDLFRKAEEEIAELKKKYGFIAYDDQIRIVHRARDNEYFRNALRSKYDAVFVDEFQDTDKYQYEIFDSLFSGYASICYIGDPKQSIYGWRGADLDTYVRASKAVTEPTPPMTKNYRSMPRMIEACNHLMGRSPAFNMFAADGEDDTELRYEKVSAGKEFTAELAIDGNSTAPITVWEFENDDVDLNVRTTASEIYRLLTSNTRIGDKKLRPSDIGVLVRENEEGEKMKEALGRYNIPSVKRDNIKVLQSREADMVRYIISAAIDPGRGKINRALNDASFGYTSKEIPKADDEKNADNFIALRKILIEDGIYRMINEFMDMYGVRSRCIENVMGQRVLTNLNHIAEILHNVEKREGSTPEELIIWMKRNRDSLEEDYEQRIEGDENAVQISTIHKAKGLEYPVVFAPFLSMIPKLKNLEKGKVNDFRKDGEYYFTMDYPGMSDEEKELFDRQKEQENRRLIYVALTRAIYKCYISYVPRIYNKQLTRSSLSDLIDQLTPAEDLISQIEPPEIILPEETERYGPELPEDQFIAKPVPGVEIKNTFKIHSFSALSTAHHTSAFEKIDLEDPAGYDQFVFQELSRGAKTGTALHSIFEYLQFDKPETWDASLKNASKFYPKVIDESKMHFFRQMVEHVMAANIEIGRHKVSLGEVSEEKMLPEMEFLFSVESVNRTEINRLLGEEALLKGESDMDGLMTGFIDLVFEQNGKYYILDWKSNYLGNSVDDYNQTGLEEAMKGSNYHLQYMIYTVALKRWLEKRIPGFDYDKHFGGVIYVFLRGVRKEKSSGIYTAKPLHDNINALDISLSRQ